MSYRNDTGLPSVTTILGMFLETKWFTEESRQRGSAVHEAAHAYLTGSYVIPLKWNWSGYFDSFKRWVDLAEPEVHSVEKRLADYNLGFCGQYDFVGKIRGRFDPGLIDWKTSLAYEKWFRLQGAAYRYLYDSNTDFYEKKTKWGGTLRLRADGSLPLFTTWPDDFSLDFNRFVGALNLYNFLKN